MGPDTKRNTKANLAIKYTPPDEKETLYAVFSSLENLERQKRKKTADQNAKHQGDEALKQQMRKIDRLKEEKEGLLQKLEKRDKALEAFKVSGGNLNSLNEEHRDLLFELEKQRLHQIQAAYRLTGTSLEVVNEKIQRLRFDTCYKGTYYEPFYIELKDQLDKFTITRHTIPSFIPFEEIKDQLNDGVKQMCSYVHTYLRAYVQRRQEAFHIQKQYSDILETELCSSPSFDYIEIQLQDFDDIQSIKLLYEDITLATPIQVVLSAKGDLSTEIEEKFEVLEKEFKSSTLSHVFHNFFSDED